MAEERVDAMELLKEEMSSDETAYKVKAIHRLSIIAKVLGPVQSNDKLIPFLNSTA